MIFHEALHGLTGLTDDVLLEALGWSKLHPSCKVNVTIQSDVLVHSVDLNPFVRMPCAWPQ